MSLWKNNKNQHKGKHSNNRLNFIIAIIFLLGTGVLFRLYNLQVKEYDLYAARATGQHEAFNILEPKRGRIFIQDSAKGNSEKLYPIATNKEFSLVYAVPKDIENPEVIAEQLYVIFKKEQVEKEVERILEEQDKERLKKELAALSRQNLNKEERNIKEAEVTKEHNAIIRDKEYLELKDFKRVKEMELRKKIIVNEYMKILTKKGDPYEPIEQKVDEEILKKMYAAIASASPATALRERQGKVFLAINGMKDGKGKWAEYSFTPEDLEVKDGGVFYKDDKDGEEKELKLDGIAFIPKRHRFYPEANIGSHVLGFVGFKGQKASGQYGLEGFFNEELSGVGGSIEVERSAGGDLIIINNREYSKPQNGSDLILTINRAIQFTACEKLNETALRHGADGGSVIIIEPKTGSLLAMCSWPDYDPNNYKDVSGINIYNNPAIFSQYEPGSIFKAITMASALDREKITPETTYNDEGSVMIAGWPKPIKNSDYEEKGGYGIVNMNTVLEKSLNTGAIFAMKQAGAKVFAEYVKDFGFGEKTGIELDGESAGNISNLLKDKIKNIDAAVASFGQGISVTPLQMVMSFAAIANGGILMKPYVVEKIVHYNGAQDVTRPKQIRRVISERASLLLSGMLVNVVEVGHAKRAGVNGYYVAGKTGTAQVASSKKKGYSDKTIHTFVGFAPVEDPQFVMLVKLDNPKAVRFAASSAAPLFGEIAEFLLNYLEIPKERK